MVSKCLSHWDSKPTKKPQHNNNNNKPSNQTGNKPNHRVCTLNRPEKQKHTGTDWFHCFDCKVWHAPGRGNHTAAGQAILDKRYGSKPKTAPKKYVRKVVPPPSNRSRCQYCDREGHLEEKCFKKQRDQKRAKEETHSQEQRPFPLPTPQRKSSLRASAAEFEQTNGLLPLRGSFHKSI